MVELVIRAAGVVLVRQGSGGPKVLLVHRPSHKDWSLPKGKLDKGEHVISAAVRECDEETGIVPILGPPVGRQTYQVMGRPKTVDYWFATPGRDSGFTPDDEIDQIRWVTPNQARSLLTYKRDVDMVRRAIAMPQTVPLVLLRHTAATKRSDFAGKDDTQRPLTGKGRSQARALVPILAAYGIDAVHSSDAARCLQTVKPFASDEHVMIEQEPLFSEAGFDGKPKSAITRFQSLAGQDARLVVCSHRPVLPDLAQVLAGAADKKTNSQVFKAPLAPGGMVVAHRKVGKNGFSVVAAERVEP